MGTADVIESYVLGPDAWAEIGRPRGRADRPVGAWRGLWGKRGHDGGGLLAGDWTP